MISFSDTNMAPLVLIYAWERQGCAELTSLEKCSRKSLSDKHDWMIYVTVILMYREVKGPDVE